MSDRQGGSRLTVPALTAMEPMFKRCAPIDAEQDIGDLVIVETFSLGTRCLATAPATPDRRCDTGDAKQCRYVIAHAHRDCTQGHGAERLAGDHKSADEMLYLDAPTLAEQSVWGRKFRVYPATSAGSVCIATGFDR